MFLKHSRGRKFTELVTHHVLGHEDGLKNLSVVNEKRVADKVRRHHRAPRPGLDRFFRARVVHFVDLFQEMRLDEGSFLQRSRHKIKLLFPPALHNEAIARFVFRACFESFGELAPRTDRVMPPAAALRFTLAAAHRVIDGIHGHAAHM